MTAQELIDQCDGKYISNDIKKANTKYIRDAEFINKYKGGNK